ncbi:SGNH/GDSL hydrolase family protein [Coraliomargarita algicola]|uniref:SGNH/GDSL hydrolase family protein n=1 Tax=Coraliomargarita algicola TaxID=3092156 RepID=A0ABZ0RLG8_9BACT|nr:SGNH/GDSL hydrolase family protein [Coraliomargarita sp. J2-16]WPJ96084.1 SGNH/GDSL hydrolase family protein [Coraliomargarita sp. J2-16]
MCSAKASNSPVWELSEEALAESTLTGTVVLEDGYVELSDQDTITLPDGLLKQGEDFTVELSVLRPEETVSGQEIFLVSDVGAEDEQGLQVIYYPPSYNALVINDSGNRCVEDRGFLSDRSHKLSLVVKEGQMSVFRDGFLKAMTAGISYGSKPYTFGGSKDELGSKYRFSEIKVYDQAIFPEGFDGSGDRMINYSGEGYLMQRVRIENPDLPRILVVGDSISMGYRRYITAHFEGRAYVDYWVGGHWFGETARGENSKAKVAWDGVLSNGPYDVISWNAMTLHMWNGSPGRCNEETYPANMTEVVDHLLASAPDTAFIWVRCTPWRTTPESGRAGLDPVHNPRIVRLNAVTDAIMRERNIPIIDTYSLTLERFDTLREGSKDAVHWPSSVNEEMAEMIIEQMEKSLSAKGLN